MEASVKNTVPVPVSAAENTDNITIDAGERYSRVRRLIGDELAAKVASLRVLLLGLGGVGSYAFEGLVRSGVRNITAVDSDSYEVSNLNRQLYAVEATLGTPKPEAAVMRAKAVDGTLDGVKGITMMITPENAADMIEKANPDIILDAIDNVSAKIAVASYAHEHGIKLIMCLGTGNRLDPSKLIVTDLAKTSGCPLARVMRRELKVRNINHCEVVTSTEEPIKVDGRTPASMVFVPAAAGMLLASRVVEFAKTIDSRVPPAVQP